MQHVKEFTDAVSREIIKIIDSKDRSSDVALQFILEELDAARSGNEIIRDKIDSLYFKDNEYSGAMEHSWDDVDGPDGPQQFLLKIILRLAQKIGSTEAAYIRILVTESIARHYKLGRFHKSDYSISAKKPLALFEVQDKNSDEFHPHFSFLLKDENKPIRDVICRWASGFEDRDNKFNHEFQTTFNSSFWEIYLYQCFKDLKINVDFSKPSPDFSITTKENNSINIEAVTANHAVDSYPEWIRRDLKENNDFLNFSCVRLLNAIQSKHQKFSRSYSKLDHVKGKPFVIALAPFEQPLFFMQNNEAIIRVLYGQGIDKDSNYSEVFTPTAVKNGKIPLELGIFTNDKYKDISAVIFSTTATVGKAMTQAGLPIEIRCSRYHPQKGLIIELIDSSEHFETHLDGLQIHHNPYAEHKLPREAFDRYEVTHYFYDVNLNRIDNQQRSYTIISRNTFFTL